MITKYQMISIMAEETAREIAKNEQAWTRYLTTAARLYKYPFNEQMLIYAQRPDASACASLETWNEKMNCWVNRGAKGIALIDTESERPRLKYVFDVSDVHKARRIGRDPYLWELKEEHKAPVLAQLEKTYGPKHIIFYNTVHSRLECAYMLFGLISPELILSKMQAGACECTLTISYKNAYKTCGICGATMRIRHEIPALFYIEGLYEGILKIGIEVKVSSGECLAKCAAVARGKDTYF